MTFIRTSIWGISVLSMLSVMVVYALPAEKTEVINEKSGHTFSLPPQAQVLEHNPNVYYLGTAIDPATDLEVEGYAILNYIEHEDTKKTAHAKGGGKGGAGAGSTCYGYIADGAKWKGTPEARVVNGTNSEGLASADLFAIVNSAVNKWEDAADGTLDNNILNIFGAGSETTNLLDAGGPLNNVNEVVFGSVDENGVIAVTIVWGIFGGSPRNRYIAERDQIYDQDDFDRSIGGSPTTMDVENIVTHEMGHSFGMGDLYTAACSSETMYGYASEGQTNARTLEAGDIAGISKLY